MTTRQALCNRVVWAAWVAMICLLPVQPVASQQITTVNSGQFPVVFLPSTRYVYYQASLIDAQAHWMVANGYQHMALARARQMHAKAASMEMDNSIKWVHTYFSRKKLNREYRRQLNPTLRERVEKADRLKHQMLQNQPEFFFKGQVDDEMNWMLDRLGTLALTHTMFFGAEAPADNSDLNKPLDQQTLSHINVSSGELVAGKERSFRMVSGTAFESDWPLVLLDEAFRSEREDFEQAKKAVIAEARLAINGLDGEDRAVRRASVKMTTWQGMQDSLDDLSKALLAVYPWEVRREPREYFRYKTGERFLKAQAAGIIHAMTTNDIGMIDGSQKFEGTTLYEAIHYMCHRGLRFSAPLDGDKSAYRKMFLMMREVYLHHRPDAAEPAEEPRPDPGGGNAGAGLFND